MPGPDRSAASNHDRVIGAAAGTHGPYRAELANAGGGLGLGIVQLSAIIPGFLPALILTLALVAVVVVPLMAVGLLAALLAAPLYGLRRLAARHR